MVDALTAIPLLPEIDREALKDPAAMIEYQVKLIRRLREYLKQLHQIANIQLQLTNVGVFYFDLPDADGVYAEGATRWIKVSSGRIELQEADSNGDWLSGDDAVVVLDR